MYYPKASETKKKELEDLKRHIKSTIRGSRIQSHRQSISELDTPNAKYLKSSNSTHKITNITKRIDTDSYNTPSSIDVN
jgi:hypothetical protein